MLIFKTRKSLFTSHIKWFCPRPLIRDAFGFVYYRQSFYQQPVLGFHCETFYTIHIELTIDEKNLLANCGKNTRYKINRARREGVQFALENDINNFVKFYNEFATTKHMAKISSSALERMCPYLCMTQALYKNDVIVKHAYLLDEEQKRARLLHSASWFRHIEQSEERNFIGRANRFLHFEDMLYFKKMGIKIYDFGGYAVDDINKEREQINQFKKGFGGQIVKEPNYMSYPLYFYGRLKAL
jgi:lipid II:glycine glycyltransferase (peptidoglycan interpeptide bridge formation enzyme)